MALLKFLKGNYSSLSNAAINEGQILICNDTAEMFVDVAADKRIKIGDFTVVANLAALEALDATAVPTSRLYYVEDGNILARSNGTTWVQVNKQPTTAELKTLLGLGSLAYLSEVSEDNLNSALKEKVNAAAEGNHAHLNKDVLDGITADDITNWNDAVNKEHEHANADELAKITAGDVEKWNNKVDKETGKSLVIDTEITKLAGVSEGANKVEASATNGSIKIDGVDTVVYTHPDKHVIDDVTGLQNAIDDAKQAGTDAANALDAYKNTMVTTLAGKQDVIPENTYDAYGASAQALADAQSYADQAEADAVATAKAYVDNADKFEIDMLTVNAHGGIAANTDLNGLTTHEILKKILYPYVEPTLGNATASPNGGTYEKGVTKTITSVSIAITKKSEVITSVALYNGSTLIEEKTGDAVKNGGTITFSNVNVEVPTNGNQLTVKVTDAANKTYEKKTSSMTFVYPYYMGSCAAGTTIDEALVESLTKKVESKGNKSNSFTVSDGHMVFAYPKAHGVLKSILDPNNFETIGNYTRSEVSITGLDGTAQAYYVYVSGATTVSGFAVNFKY